MPTADFQGFVNDLATASGEFILRYYRGSAMGTEFKADETPVTVADRGAEEIMRRMIEQRFPDHGVLGEELGTVRADAEFVWVLDPIDGTKSFITGVPLFTTLIGLLHHGRPVLGCIHQPVLKQLMIGNGTTTTLNNDAVRVRPCSSLASATLLTTDPLHPAQYQDGAAFTQLAASVRLCRTFGDGYGYLLVASGWADVMVDPVLKPWDLLPLVPVMQGAGAVITDWQGQPAGVMKADSCVAAAPNLHSEVIRRLNRDRLAQAAHG
ncbi:MAG: histidinol-phosphatase [Pedosphaera sp.]|nr:histidinol-phosphatase [Pedosphaera sp.]